MMANAKALFFVNQIDTNVDGIRLSAPCPIVLIIAKQNKSSIELLTFDNQKHPKKRKMQTNISIYFGLDLSRIFPKNTIATEANNEPNKYDVATLVDVISNSSMKEFWKILNVKVCPGPDEKLAKVHTARITQP